MAKTKITLRIEAQKPRNPLVAAVVARGGSGSHAKSHKALRRKDKADLSKSLRAGDHAGSLFRLAA